MEHIDRNNGCLAVLPGTHKGPLQPHDKADDGQILSGCQHFHNAGFFHSLHGVNLNNVKAGPER